MYGVVSPESCLLDMRCFYKPMLRSATCAAAHVQKGCQFPGTQELILHASHVGRKIFSQVVAVYFFFSEPHGFNLLFFSLNKVICV